MNTTAGKLAILIVVVSLITALAGAQKWVLLLPAAVIGDLWLWQPLSYAFVATDPLGVIFSALIMWQMGGSMEHTWGARRFLSLALGGTVLAGVLTVLLGLVLSPVRFQPFAGAYVMTSIVWISYGLSIGRGQTNFWGLPITGNVLALIGVGFIFMGGAFGSFYAMVPPIIGALLAFAYTRGFSPRLLWLRFQSWRLQSQLKGRSKHLRVISRDRNTPPDSDKYVH